MYAIPNLNPTQFIMSLKSIFNQTPGRLNSEFFFSAGGIMANMMAGNIVINTLFYSLSDQYVWERHEPPYPPPSIS